MPAAWQHSSKALSAALRTLAPVSMSDRDNTFTPPPLAPTSTAFVCVDPTSTPAAIRIVTSHAHGMSCRALGMLQRLKESIDPVLGLGFSKIARVFQV